AWPSRWKASAMGPRPAAAADSAAAAEAGCSGAWAGGAEDGADEVEAGAAEPPKLQQSEAIMEAIIRSAKPLPILGCHSSGQSSQSRTRYAYRYGSFLIYCFADRRWPSHTLCHLPPPWSRSWLFSAPVSSR
ncbi:unnamed protein product, partial [Prorocentrum cordatum]